MDILISGGGIAGATLAYWLADHGFRPTVVERSRGLRSSGSPVDVRGPAVPVAERMGVMDRLREAGTDTKGMTFVNDAGRRVGRVGMRAMAGSGAGEVELPRADLTRILHEASRDRAEYLWDDSIASMEQDEHGVTVTFDRAGPRRFDLVVGADGLHSNVRRLTFGPESDYVRQMGIYVATMPLDIPAVDRQEVVMYNKPGAAASITPVPSGALAFFAFRSSKTADFRDTEQHKRMLIEAYADAGWRVPELLDRVRAADDLFFDAVSQVRIPTWYNGRVALLGDAASCVSLFGDGSSLAMTGAFTLAAELAATPDDPQAAFQRYEKAHRRLVEPKQQGVDSAAAMLIPATRLGITARNLASRLSPLIAAARSLGRHGGRPRS